MRSGADYREALRDGRRVWVMGEGRIDDVTTHAATRAMVDAYVAWYDLHFEADWQDIALRPADARGERTPWAYVVPKSSEDLRGMGRFFFRHDVFERWQHHPHAVLWPSHCAGAARLR